MKHISNMKKSFIGLFDQEATAAYFSPGRVNLIGEHTDYNGGHVFPCAITLGTYALVAKREANTSRLYSLNMPEAGVIEFPMRGAIYDEARDWANYPVGVVRTMEEAGYRADGGLDILFYGTLPSGAGLSSSASIEVLTALILNDQFGFGREMIELVQLSQRAENTFVGVNCGIMDQFAVGMGKKDCAILLDCNTLEYRYSPIALKDSSIVITNTNKKHSLNASKYNERRRECEHALSCIQQTKNVRSLGELKAAEFDSIADTIPDVTERCRARHAVHENERTLKAVAALEKNDLVAFGQLMNASHISLMDDYDVTGEELDTLAELAWRQPGVIGSRMTGAGFGGCTVSIVKDNAIESFQRDIAAGYTKKIGYAPSFYVAGIADGTHRIEL